jgi:hypothetical protein
MRTHTATWCRRIRPLGRLRLTLADCGRLACQVRPPSTDRSDSLHHDAVSKLTGTGSDTDVEPPVSYRLGLAALDELPRYIIAQASSEEASLAERLLGQLASLHDHSQLRAGGLPLTFRPAPATADLAARALAAMQAAQRPAHVHQDGPLSEIWH